MNKLASVIGRQAVGSAEYAYNLFKLFNATVASLVSDSMFSSRWLIKNITLNQIVFTAIDAIPIITIISLGLGGIVVIQTFTQLSKFGATSLSGKILVLVFVREFSSLMTALLIISRSGSAMTTEIGNMKVNQEIYALETMGIDMVRFLVLPRTIAVVVAMLCLTIYFNLVAVLGGFIVMLGLGVKIHFFSFIENFLNYLTFKDIVICFVKSFCFGLIIPLVGSYNGLSVKKSPTEVPAQTTRTVMNAIMLCIIVDAALTVVSYIYL